MKVFESKLDTKSEQYKQRRGYMLQLLSELNLRRKQIVAQSPEAVEKLRKRGKYPAREKIRRVLDPGQEPLEIGLFAAWDMYHDIPGGYPSAGTIVQIGRVSGKLAVIVANDPLVKSGAWVEITCKKNLRAQEIAMENRLPIIYMVDSAGVYLERQAEIFPDRDHFGRIFRNNAKMAAMGIPQISVVFGFCVAGGAYLPGMSSDLAMITEHSSMFLAGPFLVKAALGQDVDMETLGGAEMHNAISGVADYRFNTEEEAFDFIRNQMAMLGTATRMPFDRTTSEEPKYDPDELLGILPDNATGTYEMREILARLVDGSRFEEFKPEYGPTLVTCFARLGGFAVGLVANQGMPVKRQMPPDYLGRPQPPQIQMGNVIYSDSANKATHFIMLCNERKIPLIFLHDVTGFMVGKEAESGGIIQDGAQFVNVQANSVVPKFTLVIRNSFGAGNYAMCGKAYDPRLIFCWPTAKVAVMDGGIAADTVLLTKKDLSETERKAFRQKLVDKYNYEASPYFIAARIMVDGILDPRETRKTLITGLEMAANNPDIPEFKTGVMRM
ncbi:MAG: acyl-CoA carboxylase subunit beta [candidate division KSB1 bacterium]|nr:acyl-CoA carboxylase subunit beta [candidate division KSB1 bacterium]MDZ7302485.1 acyl-CoA carboxylase subunit beta [candidate division KSB1 bacterium]MDZ7311920.1 acyl-CoA carboxylase subunit beta [candidate division KSB1 bacterium]